MLSLAITGCATERPGAAADAALVIAADADLWIATGASARMEHRLLLPAGNSCIDVSASPGPIGRGIDRVVRSLRLCFTAESGKTYEVSGVRIPSQPPRRGWMVRSASIADAESGEILVSREAR